MKLLFLLFLVQIPLAISAYGINLAYWQGEYPHVRENRDVGISIFFASFCLIPIIGIFVYIQNLFLSELGKYGYQFKPLPPTDWRFNQ